MIILGRSKQVNCPKSEFYRFLGYIANHPHDIRIVFENNELCGAWGSEGRIHFFSETARTIFGNYFKFTKGVGNTLYRLNCNALIEKLVNYGFTLGSMQNHTAIRANIPTDQVVNFDSGAAI